ncbi:DUF2809 domain-containing protein [Danxiaibacter flavus]|uniref:DUF2809 domain-containing protein n=1 Tax=Danxiaibacter flavus TaxID=3049108 RepID=A0ABV3ZM48_9BACT|nr:DUF2809 domain-containing protein [Chitinophagaceae bacterium DXS]
MSRVQKKWLYFVLVLINIPVGLLSRFAPHLPFIVKEYGGDVFSASCIFFGVRFLAVNKKLSWVAVVSYLVCMAIETSQLCQAPWLNKIRHTFPFGILLGYGFLWSDCLCYAVGVLIALCIAISCEKALPLVLRPSESL